jgi:hypothetical protein
MTNVIRIYNKHREQLTRDSFDRVARRLAKDLLAFCERDDAPGGYEGARSVIRRYWRQREDTYEECTLPEDEESESEQGSQEPAQYDQGSGESQQMQLGEHQQQNPHYMQQQPDALNQYYGENQGSEPAVSKEGLGLLTTGSKNHAVRVAIASTSDPPPHNALWAYILSYLPGPGHLLPIPTAGHLRRVPGMSWRVEIVHKP